MVRRRAREEVVELEVLRFLVGGEAVALALVFADSSAVVASECHAPRRSEGLSAWGDRMTQKIEWKEREIDAYRASEF